MTIHVQSDDPAHLRLMLRLKSQLVPLAEELTPDVLELWFFCEEAEAPTITFPSGTGPDGRHRVANHFVRVLTKFFTLRRKIACIIAGEAVLIDGKEARAMLPSIRYQRKGEAPPYAVFEKANTNIVEAPEGAVTIEGDYKTRHLAEALGLTQSGVRYHLRNFQSEGLKIPPDYKWPNKKGFETVRDLIALRLGAHGPQHRNN